MFQYQLMKTSRKLFDLGSARSLFTRAKRLGDTELVLTNNAGIFGVHASLENHAATDHPDVHLVCLPFWLDKIKPQHLHRDWGQTLLGFPTTIRACFKKTHPNYPLDMLVTWGMMQELRSYVIDELKSVDRVTVHDVRHEPINYKNLFGCLLGDEIQLLCRGNRIVTVPSNSHVYNWARIARSHGLDYLPSRSHTELYTLAPEDVPDPIVVMGSGLSIVWLRRDFPDKRIIAIMPNRKSELPQIPANAAIDYNSITKITEDDILDDYPEHIVLKLGGDKLTIPKANYFNAIGYVPYSSLTRAMQSHHKTERLALPEDSWVAPQNIPIGTLTQSLLHFFEKTKNSDDACELQFYHNSNIVDVMRKRVHDICGINLTEKFFDALAVKIATLSDPLDEMGELDLYVRTFEMTQNPSVVELSLFKKAIQDFQQDKKLQIHRRKPHYSFSIPTSTRSYSATSDPPESEYTGNVPKEIRAEIKEIVSAVFYNDEARIRAFDEKHQKRQAGFFTESDRMILRKVLEEAQRSYKTFSAF